jgi:hypothetical protein
VDHWIDSPEVAASQEETHWAEIACGHATTTKGRSCSFPTIARLSGPPFSAATGASTAGAVSSTPRAESDAQHAPAHSVVPKMRVPRSVRLRLRRQGRASQVRRVCSGSLALASLNLACRDHVPAFPQCSPPPLLTTAACGGLRSAPDCRPRRALLHL